MSYAGLANDAYLDLKRISNDVAMTLLDVSREEMRGITDAEILRYFTDSDEITDNNMGALVLACDYTDFETLKKLGITNENAEIVLDKFTRDEFRKLLLDGIGDCTIVINAYGEVGALPAKINNNLPLPPGKTVYDLIPKRISFEEGYTPTRFEMYRDVGAKTMITAMVGGFSNGHILATAKKRSAPKNTAKKIIQGGPYGIYRELCLELGPEGHPIFLERTFSRINDILTSSQPALIEKLPRKVASEIPVGSNQEITVAYGGQIHMPTSELREGMMPIDNIRQDGLLLKQ